MKKRRWKEGDEKKEMKKGDEKRRWKRRWKKGNEKKEMKKRRWKKGDEKKGDEKKEMNFAAKWFRRSADFILWARHRRGGAGLRGNKIYTLRRQERSPILVAMVVQQMVEREYWRKYPRANMMRPLLSPLSKDIRAQRNVTQVRNTNWFQNSVLISWQELQS